MAMKLITAASEPITLSLAKAHLRVDHTDEDTLINAYITAARLNAEARTGRAFGQQTWELALDAFPASEIEIIKPPVQSIVSVKYLDGAGIEQTLAESAYALDAYSEQRNWIIPANGTSWPSTLSAANAVKVRFVTGEGSLPKDVEAWMLLAIGTFYAQRESIAVTQGAMMQLPGQFWHALLEPYIVY